MAEIIITTTFETPHEAKEAFRQFWTNYVKADQLELHEQFSGFEICNRETCFKFLFYRASDGETKIKVETSND